MIVFTSSIDDELKTQLLYVINVAVTRLFLYDSMPPSALDKVVNVAGKV